MQTFLIVIHLMIVLALVGVVLLQRSEGGGLGIGGGSGFMTARGASNALTRATAILATGFFVTSLALSLHARYQDRPTDILDRVPVQNQDGAPVGGQGGVLDQLGGSTPAAPSPEPAAPTGSGTSAPTGAGTTAPTAPANPAPQPAAPASPSVPAAPGGESSAPAGSAPTPAPASPATPPAQ